MAKSKPAPKPEETETPKREETIAPESVANVTAEKLNEVVEHPAPNERTIAAMNEDTPATAATPAPAATPSASPAASTAPAAEPRPGDLDDAGNAYDPAKHNPRRNRKGLWAGKQGRPPGHGSSAPKSDAPAPPRSVVGTVDGAPGSSTAAIGDRFDLAAELYTRAGYSVLDGVFSADGEWLPESDGEHVALRGAVATYLRHKGTDDLPPGLAVSLALATYGAKRISKPNTSTRVRLYFAWVRAKWQSWRTGREIDQLPRAEIRANEKHPLPPQNNLPTVATTPAATP